MTQYNIKNLHTQESLYVHAPRTPRYPPALLQALELALAGVLGLAFHKVIVIVLAPGADKERGRKKRSRSGSELLDLRNRFGQGRGVNKLLSIEPVSRRQSGLQLEMLGFWRALLARGEGCRVN